MGSWILTTLLPTIGGEIKAIGYDKAKSHASDFVTKKQQKSALKDRLTKQLDNEKAPAYSDSREYDFDPDALKESVLKFIVNDKALQLLIDSDDAAREREQNRIRNQCIQDSKAVSEEAKNKVKEIVDHCLQNVDEFYIDKLTAELSALAKLISDSVNQHTDEAAEETAKKIDEASSKLNRHTDEVAAKITSDVNRHMDEKIDELITLIRSQSGKVQNSDLCSDNEEYLDLFKRRLFLDSDNPNITLESMFISPLVQNGTQKAEDCIMEWYQKDDSSCMILYGEAGIGKSSLVAKLISKACENTDTKDDPDKAPFLAVALRDHCERFSRKKLPDGYSAKDVILDLFNAKSIRELQGKLLILDGFDELTVLSNGFGSEEAKTFINNLAVSCKKLKILITSREGYFDNKQLDKSISQESLCWKDKQVADWCERYGKKNPLRAAWCGDFPDRYQKLPRDIDDDKRYQILCIPFILYLCCNSEVNINENKSIGKIYDKAFRQILFRTHGNQLTGEGRFLTSRTDIERRLVHWQYTKEIAYQMFLQDTLDLSDAFDKKDKRRIGFDNAINRTKQVMEIKGIDLNDTDLFPQEYLSVFRFATKKGADGKSGISFVHKTVYEYFTAVKLYEDYFAKFSKSYFDECIDKNGEYSSDVVHEVMVSFIKAFRYKPIKEEDHIFQYLCEMNEPQFNGENRKINEDERFDFEQYSTALITGMELHYLSDFEMPKRIEAYNTPEYMNLPVSAQINLAFCNFTWFLTGRDFKNPARCMSYNLGDLIGSRYHVINLARWNLSHTILENADLKKANLYDTNLRVADLFEADLREADLREADLQVSNLQKANLQGAELQGARLQKAKLQEAKLQEAKLQGAQLREADLREADLQRANLQGANLQETKLHGANMKNADLRYADLQEAKLLGVNLQDAKLQRANLQGTDLQGANLRGGELQAAILRGAELQTAGLRGAKLPGANLQKADLRDADLQWVDMRDAKLQGANLQAVDLRGADLQGAKLQRANLQKAKLQSANLLWADLRNAELRGAEYCMAPIMHTVFPDGFDPKEHGMIEVDKDGNPVV